MRTFVHRQSSQSLSLLCRKCVSVLWRAPPRFYFNGIPRALRIPASFLRGGFENYFWSSQLDVLFFDLARSTRGSYKYLSFNYKNQSQSFRVNLEEDITNFLRVVKGHFQINDEIAIGFRLASTETIIVIMRTEDFWLLSADALPEYDIIAREKKGESPELLPSCEHELDVSRLRTSRPSNVDLKNPRTDSAFPRGWDVCAKESDRAGSYRSPCLVWKIWRGGCWFILMIARSTSFLLFVSSIMSLLTSFARIFIPCWLSLIRAVFLYNVVWALLVGEWYPVYWGRDKLHWNECIREEENELYPRKTGTSFSKIDTLTALL